MAFLMAAKYVLRVKRMAEWEYQSLEDWNNLEAEWMAWRRVEWRGDQQGLDLGEGLEVGVFEVGSELIVL